MTSLGVAVPARLALSLASEAVREMAQVRLIAGLAARMSVIDAAPTFAAHRQAGT